MSENLDHDSGGTQATGDVFSYLSVNIKMVVIQSSTPTEATQDGHVWVDTTTDPPLLKTYDVTNDDYQDIHQVLYESVTLGYKLPLTTPIINGFLKLQYGTDDTESYLWIRSNGAWYGVTS